MRTCARLVAAAAVLLLPLSSVAQTFSGFETRLTADPGDQFDPAINGNLVVFTDFRGVDTDVYYVDLTDGTEHVVTTAPGNQQLTDVSNGLIVYTDYSTIDVMLFNTNDQTTQNLTNAALSNSLDPAISQNLVAWVDDRDGNLEIYARNLSTNEERRITNSADTDQKPKVGGSIIVWDRCDALGNCHIWSYDWTTGVTTQLTNTTGSEIQPDIDGHFVVYQGVRNGEKDIFLYDLSTSTEKQLSLPGDQVDAHISGDYVAFDDLSEGVYHVKLWHHPSGSVFQVQVGTSGQYLNDIDGNRIVYTDDRNGDLDIYMFTFQVVFPHDDSCREVDLTASRTYDDDGHGDGDDDGHHHHCTGHHGEAHDGFQIIAPAMSFAVPAEITVTAGKSGAFNATFGFGMGWKGVLCSYLGDASGTKYLFQHCSDGTAAGAVVKADWVWLHVEGGDSTAGETDIKLVLDEVEPCAGALPPDCDHLDGAVPLVDATFTRHGHHSPNFYGMFFLASGTDGLFCLDNGASGQAPITDGHVWLNKTEVVSSSGWTSRVEEHLALKSVNFLSVELDGQPGAARVRVFGAKAKGIPPPGAAKPSPISQMYAPQAAAGAVGCSQGGAGLPGVILVLLVMLAVLPRPALGRSRMRR